MRANRASSSASTEQAFEQALESSPAASAAHQGVRARAPSHIARGFHPSAQRASQVAQIDAAQDRRSADPGPRVALGDLRPAGIASVGRAGGCGRPRTHAVRARGCRHWPAVTGGGARQPERPMRIARLGQLRRFVEHVAGFGAKFEAPVIAPYCSHSGEPMSTSTITPPSWRAPQPPAGPPMGPAAGAVKPAWYRCTWVLVTGAALVGLTLTGCDGTSVTGGQEADINLIESEITAGVQDQSGVAVTVDCPSSVEWEVGRTFHCVVEASDGSRAMANVTMENDDGDITWELN